MSIATGWCGARHEQWYSVAQQRELHTRRRHPGGCGAEAGCPEDGRGGFTQRSLGHSMYLSFSMLLQYQAAKVALFCIGQQSNIWADAACCRSSRLIHIGGRA